MTSKYAGKVRAPDFPPGAEWLNVPEPLTMADFAGRLLVLDFWTYCCINCMHMIPTLRRLEREFASELAVVGVHSAKFREEQATEHIRQAVLRYGVSHPVVNDASHAIWQSFAIRAWPTLTFIDPEGKVIGQAPGEMGYEQALQLITEMLSEFRQAGVLDPRPLPSGSEAPSQGILSFPGKVLVDEENERVFIADTGHNRVLVTDLDGVVQTVVGSGERGFGDGVLEGAQFNQPQGMAISGDTLFVADTENHAIRAVDLEASVVETIAGTGRQGAGRVDGDLAITVDLRSPWDLELVGRTLYVAMAGSHQIWALNLDDRIIQAVVGAGGEHLQDGPPEEALLAQPSGLTADEEGLLYFADSESSSIRWADLTTIHHVGTLVGTGLFDFGDADGDGDVAKLQHPLGVDIEGGVVYVADTYNHKIRRVGTETMAVATLAGDGQPGHRDGSLPSARFYEPGGLSVAGARIYVADTNNHAIRVVDAAAGIVSTLDVDF